MRAGLDNAVSAYRQAVNELAVAVEIRDFRRYSRAEQQLHAAASELRQALLRAPSQTAQVEAPLGAACEALQGLVRILRDWQSEIHQELAETRRRKRRSRNLNRSYQKPIVPGSNVSFRR